tara:strand:- start:422 stop:613 length:192 start_codon:yes stop_codon:yes gene_type:complete
MNYFIEVSKKDLKKAVDFLIEIYPTEFQVKGATLFFEEEADCYDAQYYLENLEMEVESNVQEF